MPFFGCIDNYIILNFNAPLKQPRTAEETMKNPLESIVGTIIAGFVLTGVLYLIVSVIV
jgi:hypothetical protein